MQAVESQTLILHHSDLRGEWPDEAARAFAVRLPYPKRLQCRADTSQARASLAGIALAVSALRRLAGGAVRTAQLRFASGEKPRLLMPPGLDFSIAHSGDWAGCAAVRAGRVGFDIESGSEPRLSAWVAREAAVKAAGLGLRAFGQVQLGRQLARLAGQAWYARPIDLFAGAVSWVMTDIPVARVEARAVPLTELFAP